MKKILNRKVYDTETAKYLAEYEHSYKSQFNWYREELYQKKTGEFFIYGEGHAASPYAYSSGNGWDPGEKIVPITEDAARKWVETHLDAEDYESIFGLPDEDSGNVDIKLSMPEVVVATAKVYATRHNTSVSKLVSGYLSTLSD